ncbi:hypothetical protein IMCC3317_35390 [Kordia antarctica]|uniref:Uncharacterized protein n=1 Tax=Kordia antarctica TaxID=1218801 RepID=A0A7L4ZNB4_9FLAO|nr:hypothetical protein [Kordia antarctica]QHI38152.1 hypothetical protein IMCC3317_35390 [Kordia antarctica]
MKVKKTILNLHLQKSKVAQLNATEILKGGLRDSSGGPKTYPYNRICHSGHYTCE